jgi:nitronate monooxygenase
MGNPARFVDRIHAAGALVCAAATTVAEAVELESAGVDLIVAQGAEAGGHRATFRTPSDGPLPLVGTLVLVPCIVDAVRVPVIASGGIMDGRGLAAALALGASGVQMGTRFLMSRESGAYPDYRQRLEQARETDTFVTRQFTGRPARSLPNRLTGALEAASLDPLPWPYQGAVTGDLYSRAIDANQGDFAPLLAGQGTPLARSGQGAAEIVAEVAAQARQVLYDLASRGG